VTLQKLVCIALYAYMYENAYETVWNKLSYSSLTSDRNAIVSGAENATLCSLINKLDPLETA